MKWLIVFLLTAQLSAADLGSLPEAELRALAAKDDVPAMVELAHRQYDGRIAAFDEEFVLKAFQSGSEAGIASAHTGLADCHISGVGMAKDNTPVVKLLEMAMEQGDPQGMLRLGWYFLRGVLVPQDEDRGMKMIRKASELGCLDADAVLARFTLVGDGEERDQKAGLDELRTLAEEKGNATAATILGNYYRGKYGDETVKDEKLSKKYFLIAAEMNDATAMIALGDMVLGPKPWEAKHAAKQEGTEWYRKAVARNSAEAMRKLGGMQVRDSTVRKPGEDWYQLWLDADSKGDEIATFKLAEINYHAPGYFFRDLNWSKSAAFYEKYLSGNPQEYRNVYLAVDRLLEMYFNGGQGLERDFNKCLKIAQGHLDLNPAASAYAGRILLHPDAPMGKSREHFIRGYACMLRSRAVWKMQRATLYWISDDALFVLRSRHGMTQGEVQRAEELFRQGYPNPEIPILP